MKKYLIAYQLWKNDEWQQYIEEVSLADFVYILEKVANNSIDNLFISFKALQPAIDISKNTAKALLEILIEEQDSAMQKACDELFHGNEN